MGLERLPNRGELNEISHSVVQQIFPDCLLDARHCFKHREEVILRQASLLGMLQAPNKCQLWSAHTPVFAETHTVVVGVRGHRCAWTLSCLGDPVLMNTRRSDYAISCLVLMGLGYNSP